MGKTQGVMTPASPARKAMSRKLQKPWPEDAGGDDPGESGEEGYEQEAPEALAAGLAALGGVSGGSRGGVHLYGHLALIEGALCPVAGLVLEVSGHREGLLRGGDDDLAELRSALEVLDVDAEALV